jgi:hypothetical protein
MAGSGLRITVLGQVGAALQAVLRVRHRGDLYAHEALDGHVIDGLLESKAIVGGTRRQRRSCTGRLAI